MDSGDLIKIVSLNEVLTIIGVCLERCYHDKFSYKILYDGKTADFDTRFWTITVL